MTSRTTNRLLDFIKYGSSGNPYVNLESSSLRGPSKWWILKMPHLSLPLLIRSNNVYTMKPRPLYLTQSFVSMPNKDKKNKKIDFYKLVLKAGWFVQNFKNKNPYVCYLLIYWPILKLFAPKCLFWYILSLNYSNIALL